MSRSVYNALFIEIIRNVKKMSNLLTCQHALFIEIIANRGYLRFCQIPLYVRILIPLIYIAPHIEIIEERPVYRSRSDR